MTLLGVCNGIVFAFGFLTVAIALAALFVATVLGLEDFVSKRVAIFVAILVDLFVALAGATIIIIGVYKG